MSSGWLVYLLGHESEQGLVRPIKAGVSKGPWSRIKTLQTGSSRELAMLAIFHAGSREDAYAIERLFQESLAVERFQGEWFDVGPTDAVATMCDCFAAYYAERLPPDALYRRLIESGARDAYQRVLENRSGAAKRPLQ